MSSSIPSSSVIFNFDPASQSTHVLAQGVKVQVAGVDIDETSDKFRIRMDDGSTRTLTTMNNKLITASTLSIEQRNELLGYLQSTLFKTAFATDRHFTPGTCKVLINQVGPLFTSKVSFADSNNKERDSAINPNIDKKELSTLQKIVNLAVRIGKPTEVGANPPPSASTSTASLDGSKKEVDAKTTASAVVGITPTLKSFDMRDRADSIANKQCTPQQHQARELAALQDQHEAPDARRLGTQHLTRLARLDAQLFTSFLQQPPTSQHTFFSIGYGDSRQHKWPGPLKQALLNNDTATNVLLDWTHEYNGTDLIHLFGDLKDVRPAISRNEAMDCFDRNLQCRYFSCGLPYRETDEYPIDSKENTIKNCRLYVETALKAGQVIYFNHGADASPPEWLLDVYNEMKAKFPDQIFFILSYRSCTFVKKGTFKNDETVVKAYDCFAKSLDKSIEEYSESPFEDACKDANNKLGDGFEFMPDLDHPSQELDQAAQRRAKTQSDGAATGSAAAPAETRSAQHQQEIDKLKAFQQSLVKPQQDLERAIRTRDQFKAFLGTLVGIGPRTHIEKQIQGKNAEIQALQNAIEFLRKQIAAQEEAIKKISV